MSENESENCPGAPVWKEQFPVSWLDDDYVTRRDFTKSLGLVSLAAFVATAAVAVVSDLRRRGGKVHTTMKLAKVADIPIGQAQVFHYPTHKDACLLVRLSESEFVAYSQHCTHLGCPVFYRHSDAQFVCPCHEGYFSADDGRVLAGPPKRALPKIEMEIRGEEIWTTGIIA